MLDAPVSRASIHLNLPVKPFEPGYRRRHHLLSLLEKRDNPTSCYDESFRRHWLLPTLPSSPYG